MSVSHSAERYRVSQIDHVELFIPDRRAAATCSFTDPYDHQLEVTTHEYEYDVTNRLLRGEGLRAR